MKAIYLLSTICILSASAWAKPIPVSVVCEDSQKQVSISVNLSYEFGKVSGRANIDNIKFELNPSKGMLVFEGFDGDHDNYQLYQLTVLQSDNQLDPKSAVLITQDHTDRVGFTNTITQLKCQ